MSKLPPYLDNIINIMARAEERSGGMKATQAAAVFREELINESLTAKANPGKVNPRLSKGLKPSYFNKRELARGTAIELEHTDSRKVAERIAMDHLTEDENYYKKLEKMEANPRPKGKKFPDDNDLDVLLPIEVLPEEKRKKLNFKLYTRAKDQLGNEYSAEVKDGVLILKMGKKDYRHRIDDFLSRAWLDEGLGESNELHRIYIEYIEDPRNNQPPFKWHPPISEKYLLDSHKLVREIIEKVHKIFPETKEEMLKSNPTVKPFHEIYEVAGKQFADSPLGKSLGGFNGQVKTGGDRGMGRKFFEDLRNFCSNTSDSVIKGIFEKQLKRFNPGSKMPYDSFLENAGGEYPKGGLKNKDVKERVKIQREVESVRYYRLAVSTIIFGLIEPIFQMTKDDLELFLYAMLPQPRNFSDEEMRQGKHLPEIAKILEKIASPKQRKSFIEAILQIMKEREGIVSASIKASEYIGGQYWSGRKIEENVLMQVAELKKIKDDSGKVAVVPPEAMIPR